ncbi:MAG: sporulation protein YabP [Clostridia bacterium]|nr:sporulation protein YabP [Clostridia bacterium]
MAEERNNENIFHNINMENREMLTVSGVSDVDSFDDKAVTVFTDMGELTIRGENLHINSLSTEVGELSMEGRIDSLTYTDNRPQAKGFFNKVFR